MRQVILASTSQTRISLLQAAGVDVTAIAPGVDEDEVKRALKGEGAAAADAAIALAELKATRISRRYPDALVIGADQMLDCQGQWFDKPADLAVARTQLQALRSKTHHLQTAAVVMINGQRIWHQLDKASLTMRPFSDAFLDEYLNRVGDKVLWSVGGYQLEGLGVQLFSRIDGSYFGILGLPLLPLLDFLRTHEVIAS